MPLPERAAAAVAAAARWNHDGAVELLGILPSAPDRVAVKEDPCGPLHLLFDGPNLCWAATAPPFPTKDREGCAAFGREWRARAVSVAELADVLAIALPEGRRVRRDGHGWGRLA